MAHELCFILPCSRHLTMFLILCSGVHVCWSVGACLAHLLLLAAQDCASLALAQNLDFVQEHLVLVCHVLSCVQWSREQQSQTQLIHLALIQHQYPHSYLDQIHTLNYVFSTRGQGIKLTSYINLSSKLILTLIGDLVLTQENLSPDMS